ncbi:MAG: N-acetylneuraminate synthase family protein [Chitinophagaceae bacterium]|nr:N-acetylneuraminate synthase family protein [Chitinophagaceae bacterium]MCB9054673.1 N-acetylneuraminate synthase family protein [Chitinophagales bacterium]
MSSWKGKHGPLLIAEIGGNHEGDFAYAKKLTELAIESDADFIKFQLYTGDTLVSPVESEQRNKHFKKFELSPEQHIELAKMCINAGKKYMASVWNPDFIDWIDPYIPVYKIGSGDLTAYPVLRKFALLGKPMIISTGLATMEEVIASVEFIQSVNSKYKSADYLALLQCTSMYPIGFEDANLEVMESFRKATGLSVGYSDHTEGTKALEVAVAMGAEILEFHFTDTKEGKTFRDHKVSLTKQDVWSLIEQIKTINLLKGSDKKVPVAIEIENGHVISFRRAVYPSVDMEAGTVLSTENLVTLRPNHGIDARDFDKLIGKKIKVGVKAFEKIEWDMVE